MYPRDIIVLDFETTGLSVPRGAEPVQVGAVRLDARTLAERATFTSTIRPETPERASVRALAVSGLDLRALRLAPRSLDVMRAFEREMFSATEMVDPSRAALVMAHNAGFDRAFYRLWRERAGHPEGRHARGDQFVCSKRFLERTAPSLGLGWGRSGWGLDALSADLGRPRGATHDALDDVRIVARLLEAMHERLARWEAARVRSQLLGCLVGEPRRR